MKITQLSIFLENRSGRLYEVTKLLGDNNINIIGLTIAETENFGVLRLVVNDVDKATKILNDNNFIAKETDVIVVEIDDKAGTLAELLKIFDNNNINIEYMYAVLSKQNSNKAYMIFRIDNIEKAADQIKNSNYKLIKNNELNTL